MNGTLTPLRLSLVVLATATLAVAQVASPKPEDKREDVKTALLVIDVQSFYFEGGKLPLAGPLEASQQARKVLERFRARHWPVIHVQHLPAAQAAPSPDGGDPQYRIHTNVLPVAGERVVGKHFANAFRDTELLATLHELGVKKLVICGMQTQMCVEAATRAAADLGFEVTVIHDACATRDLAFGDRKVPAAEVHAAALAAMSGTYARVISAEQFLAETP